MAKSASVRLRGVLPIVTAIVLLYPTSARGERIDIADPSVLGPRLIHDVIYDANQYEQAFTDVRYEDGIYSYIYAVSGSPYFPSTSCCEAHMVSYAVTGHPLDARWGSINGSDVFWSSGMERPPAPTAAVESIVPLDDGFLVVSTPNTSHFAVVYIQSLLPPARDGHLTYTGSVRDHDHGGIVVTESGQPHPDVLVPVPEPASIVLLGLGLGALVTRTRGRNTCRTHVR